MKASSRLFSESAAAVQLIPFTGTEAALRQVQGPFGQLALRFL